MPPPKGNLGGCFVGRCTGGAALGAITAANPYSLFMILVQAVDNKAYDRTKNDKHYYGRKHKNLPSSP